MNLQIGLIGSASYAINKCESNKTKSFSSHLAKFNLCLCVVSFYYRSIKMTTLVHMLNSFNYLNVLLVFFSFL